MKNINNKKLLIATVTGVALIGLTTVSLVSGSQNAVSSTGTESVSWVNRILSKPAELIGNVSATVSDIFNTYQENQELKPYVNTLFSVQTENEQLKLENQKLKEQLALKETLTDYTVVSATVISRTPDTWVDQIIINVGANDGVKENMAVMSDKGVIGKISSVSANSSKVVLLSNTTFDAMSLSAMIQENNSAIYGVASRYDATSKKIIMTNIDLNANVQAGQRVVTSGLSGLVPRGLVIGTVDSVSSDASGLFKEAKITPAGDFNDIQYLFVVISGGNSEQ